MNKTTFSPNDNQSIENDEIRNSFDEIEDGWAIPECNPSFLDSTDLDENESYYVDKNNEPPDFRVGYNLVDEHVHYYNTTNDDKHLGEHVEGRPFENPNWNETFYESLE